MRLIKKERETIVREKDGERDSEGGKKDNDVIRQTVYHTTERNVSV